MEVIILLNFVRFLLLYFEWLKWEKIVWRLRGSKIIVCFFRECWFFVEFFVVLMKFIWCKDGWINVKGMYMLRELKGKGIGLKKWLVGYN